MMVSKCCMVLDVDIGIDDAVALLMALSQPSVDLIGITCVHGNTALSNVLVNALRVLKISNRLEVSRYQIKSCFIGISCGGGKGDSHCMPVDSIQE